MTNEEAINLIQEIEEDGRNVTSEHIEALKLAIEALEERPHGEWIIKAEDYYKAVNERGGGVDENTPYFVDDIACPKCLTKFSVIDNETEKFKCCPNCGARMEKEAENE